MASNEGSMTFLAFPREIRDLIYPHLTTNDQVYLITPAKTVRAKGAAKSNLGIINACKTTQREMLEMLCPHNTIRFLLPAYSTSEQSTYHELAASLKHVEFYVDFRWLDYAAAGYPTSKIRHVGNPVCEALLTWNSNATRRESCQIMITNNLLSWSSPVFRKHIVEAIKTLVGLETLLIKILETVSSLWELETLLGPSLGPSTVSVEKIYWESIDGESPNDVRSYRTLRCFEFHPRSFVAEVQE